jgi:hypothetical protein
MAIVAAARLADNQRRMPDPADMFPASALAENRSGHLTSEQAARFQRMVSGRRQGMRGLALPFAAIGALLLFMSGPEANAVTRHLTGLGFLAAAAALILVAPAFDPLAFDVRENRVATVEGAIGKRRVQTMGHTGTARYYLIVGRRQLRTSRSACEAAPEAGYVRAYFLPRTRKLVNLERLPNRPLPNGPDEAREMLGGMARALVSGDRAAFAEARANAAGVFDAAQDAIRQPSDAMSRGAEGNLGREALVGKWTHPLVTVTLAEDGTATVTTMMGVTQAGHWLVDGHGRLLTDVTGTMAPTQAALDGGRLTIQLEGQRLTFTRRADN